MQETFAGKLFNAISWTLVHSLWQGLLLTLIVAVILFTTKKSAPAFRYSLLTALLFCFIGTVAITFISQWQQSPGTATPFADTITTRNVIVHQNNWWNTITDFLNHYSTSIIAMWAAVVLMKLVRMLHDLYYVNRMRSSRISHPEESWTILLQQLTDKMGIRKKVRLFESQLINIPVVAGHIKPVILLPVGMLTQLSMAEVEAVLLHELAHIRRHDYLINLIQRITGILFFFNPGILWLSSLIRLERENCCDDMAITHTHDKLAFVEALISVKQHAMSASPLAMNFLGQKNLLLHRVNRIVYSRNKSLNIAELCFVVISIIAAALYFMNARSTVPTPAQQPAALAHILSATQVSNAIYSKSQQEIVTSTKPDAERPSLIIHHLTGQPRIKKISKETATITKHDIVAQAIPSATIEKEKLIAANSDYERYRSLAEQDRMQAEKDRFTADLDRKQAEKDRAQADLDRKQAEKDRVQADKDRLQAELDRKQADKDRAQAMRDAKAAATIL